MKFLSALALLATSASAASVPRQRPLFSRYELSLSTVADAPYSNGAVSLKDNAAGFYASQTDPIVIDIQDGAAQNVRLALGGEGVLALEGDSGLRDLVLVGEEVEEQDGGFALELREGEEQLYNVTWGGKGEWLVQSVGEDDFQLKWWDGEGVTVATVFPVQLVGKLTAQSRA